MSMTATHTEITLDTDTVDTIAILEAEAALADTKPAEGAARASRATIAWTEADSGLWVANYGGYYGGTVDKQGAHYFASDTFGEYVGDYRSLEEAQTHLSERLRVMLPTVIRPVA